MGQQLYDSIGERYERTKYIPTGQVERATLLAALSDSTDPTGQVEQATLLAALPDPAGPTAPTAPTGLGGRTILDVGTGTGFYPRIFAELGAANVLGVDSSGEMVAIAENLPRERLDYLVHDALELPVLGEFDLVTAIWLVNYATDDAELTEMFARMGGNLTKGGSLVVLGPNPDIDWDVMADAYRRYGYTMRPDGPIGRRTACTFTLADGGPDFAFPSAIWAPGAITDALGAAGFDAVERRPTTLPGGPGFVPRPGDQAIPDDPDYWDYLLRSPAMVVYRASRG